MRFPRAAGVLLHPTSLPGPFGIGDMGQAAYDFVDFLAQADQSLWQGLEIKKRIKWHMKRLVLTKR